MHKPKLTPDISDEDLEKLAIIAIGIVDYDTEKECLYNLEEDGTDPLVDQMKAFLYSLVA